MTQGEETPTPELLLRAYAGGYFPMARTRHDPKLHWFSPDRRGVLPLDGFRVPRSLAKFLKKQPFVITVNHAFERVIRACADIARKQDDSWINDAIIALYCELHRRGFAHSVECWKSARSEDRDSPEPAPCEDPRALRAIRSPRPAAGQVRSGGNRLIGGLYGVALGGAFFGESMFSLETNASKAALVHLVARLREGGYRLLDAQYANAHLQQFGIVEIAREEYLELLNKALEAEPIEGL